VPEFTLHELSAKLGVELQGDGNLTVHGVGSLAHAVDGQLSHLSSHRYLGLLNDSQATAVLIAPEHREQWPGAALVCPNPYLAYARATQLFVRRASIAPGIHPSAVVAPDATVDPTACIGPGVVIGANCSIGAGAELHAHCSLGDGCHIGANTRLMANVVCYADVRLGERCVVHSGAVLGADGFGYTPDAQGHMVEIAQLGGVRIGDDVSIGSATTVDRGALDHTEIAEGVKIDNQVQIGHNCYIGAHTLICGCVGVVGSSRIGKHCVLAGGSGVGGDGPVELCDGVMVTAMTLISKTITKPGVYSGAVLHAPTNQWKRNALRFQQLDGLARRVSRLEKSGS